MSNRLWERLLTNWKKLVWQWRMSQCHCMKKVSVLYYNKVFGCTDVRFQFFFHETEWLCSVLVSAWLSLCRSVLQFGSDFERKDFEITELKCLPHSECLIPYAEYVSQTSSLKIKVTCSPQRPHGCFSFCSKPLYNNNNKHLYWITDISPCVSWRKNRANAPSVCYSCRYKR